MDEFQVACSICGIPLNNRTHAEMHECRPPQSSDGSQEKLDEMAEIKVKYRNAEKIEPVDLSDTEKEALDNALKRDTTLVAKGSLQHVDLSRLPDGSQEELEEMAMLIRLLASTLKRTNPDSNLPEQAMDYLREHGLQDSPLR